MHFLIIIAIISGGVWLAIEYPNFRKALLITGAGFLVLCVGVALLLMAH